MAPIILFGLPVLAALGIIGWYNGLRFGSPLTTGYLPQENFATPFLEGFYGLTLSPGKGLLWYNPLLWAALAAWPAFFRRHRAEALLSAAIVLSNLAFYAPWYLWWAGHAWGPRFLVTMLPFAVLPLAEAIEAARRQRWLAVGLAALAGVSVAVQILGVAVDFNRYLEAIHAQLGLYHPATLFNPAYSPLLRQWAYLRPANLDLAWARDGTVDWGGLAVDLALVLLSAGALWAARRGRLGRMAGGGLAVALAVGAVASLIFYAPQGDVAEAAALLTAVERPGEGAALAEPLWTEAWQDAYDGGLWVWGAKKIGPISTDRRPAIGPIWTIGDGGSDPAAARFQVGAVRLDYFAPVSPPFDAARLPVPLLADRPRLGDAVELVAVQLGEMVVRQGETLPLGLYWRALAPLDTSYTVFVQAIDESGVKAGQLDRLPCHGGCPTDAWRPGDLIGERYDLPLRPDAPPGDYRLIVGLYELSSGQHLLTAGGQPYLLLGPLRVAP